MSLYTPHSILFQLKPFSLSQLLPSPSKRHLTKLHQDWERLKTTANEGVIRMFIDRYVWWCSQDSRGLSSPDDAIKSQISMRSGILIFVGDICMLCLSQDSYWHRKKSLMCFDREWGKEGQRDNGVIVGCVTACCLVVSVAWKHNWQGQSRILSPLWEKKLIFISNFILSTEHTN